MTSIFSSSWMCRLCGREACAECFAKVRELTQYRPGASDSEIAALQAKRESHAHTNPFFLSCTRRNEHQYSDFSPMSRFDKTELEGVIESMEKLLREETGIPVPVAGSPGSNSNPCGPAGVPGVSKDLELVRARGLAVSWSTSVTGSLAMSDTNFFFLDADTIGCGEGVWRVNRSCSVVSTPNGDSSIEWDRK